MGTRADFYVGLGADAEWLGSIAWDGYPDAIDAAVLTAKSEEGYRASIGHFFATRDDVALPAAGWPWPWDTSHTTDFAYALEDGVVYASCFGQPWQTAAVWLEGAEEDEPQGEAPDFPNMAERKNVRWDKGSGVMVISMPDDSA